MATHYLAKINSLDWSDDDDDERYKSYADYIPNPEKHDHLPSVSDRKSTSSTSSTITKAKTRISAEHTYVETIVDPKYKYDRKPSKYFSGALKSSSKPLTSASALASQSKILLADRHKSLMPINTQEASILSKISINILEIIWDEWLECGSDIHGMIELEKLQEVTNNLRKRGFSQLPLDQVSFPHHDPDDYVSFSDFTTKLVQHIKTPEKQSLTVNPLPPCCGRRACRCNNQLNPSGYKKAQDEVPMQSQQKFLLYSLYNQSIIAYSGRIKINHMIDIMKKEHINCDKSRIPLSYWLSYGEFLIENFQEFEEIYHCLRVVGNQREALEVGYEANDRYQVSRKLMRDFHRLSHVVFRCNLGMKRS
jgi:hypothetical protein